MSLTQKIKERKQLDIEEFRKNVLPKYLEIMEENKKAEQRRLIYDRIMGIS
jgi:hypothetical protein